MKKVLLPLVLVLIVSLILGGCASSTPTPATSAPPSTSNAPATSKPPTSAAPTTSAVPTSAPATSKPPATSASPSAGGTLKIGLIGWLGWPLGLDMMHGDEVLADQINKAGGIKIGGQNYQIQLIEYDSQANQSTAVAAANRLIFEDKVSFIAGDNQFVDAWFPIADSNKVIALVQANSQEAENPKYNYVFNASYLNAQNCVLPGWYATKNPTKKSIAIALPDTQLGHSQGPVVESIFKPFGMTVTTVYYPANQQDQSALGTRIKTMNPDVFMAIAGGPVADGLCYKAVAQAGYKGTLMASTPAPFGQLSQVIPASALEGFVNYAYPVEFDPALTPMAQDFRKNYIAKFGKWDDPDISETALFTCLMAALQKADSTDPTKVAAAIAGGLTWEGPTGPSQMINRPDLGNNRTVDSVVAYYIKQIQGGKPVKIDQISIDNAIKYFRIAFPTSSPSPTK